MEMTPYHRFVSLTQFDQLVLMRRKEVSDISERMEAIKREIDEIHRKNEEMLSSVRELRKKRDALELEAKSVELDIQKKQKKMETSSDAKAYTAFEHEIAVLKTQKSELEESVFLVWQELEDQEKSVADFEAAKTQRVEACQARLDVTRSEFEIAQAGVKELELERQEKLNGVPAEWLVTYESMLQKYANPVVSVQDNSCTGCGFPVPSGDRSTIFRHVIVPCQQCRRLLIDPRVIDELSRGDVA